MNGIIKNMQERGIHLTATDKGTIKVSPAGLLTDADRDLLRKHKPEVLAELQGMNVMNFMNIDSGSLPPPRIVRDDEPMFTDRAEAAQTLLTTMRAIGLRVRLTAQGELRIGPQHMLWPYDIETITELKPELVTILQKELHQ